MVSSPSVSERLTSRSWKARAAAGAEQAEVHLPPYEDEIRSVEGPDVLRGGLEGTAPANADSVGDARTSSGTRTPTTLPHRLLARD